MGAKEVRNCKKREIKLGIKNLIGMAPKCVKNSGSNSLKTRLLEGFVGKVSVCPKAIFSMNLSTFYDFVRSKYLTKYGTAVRA